MKIILTTPRLLLREFESGDAPFIFNLMNSPGWLRYIGDRKIRTLEDASNYIRNGPMRSYGENGYGLWLVALAQNQVPAGMCGLLKRQALSYPDLGFAFLPSFEGNGYAQEIASATLAFAMPHWGLEKILAIAQPDNDRSIRLLKKPGMQMEKEMLWEDTGERLLQFATAKNLAV